MKTVCLYFQVHQPWRLKKYRFFNMGKDHNYLDDLLNRSIMQKVARQCYLPMNALFGEILLRSQRGQRVGVSLGEELYATRGGQFLERFEDFGRIGAELFDGDARDRERAAELTPTRWPRWLRRRISPNR